jgi:DNA-binding LacI/PurR family transcriptional regulator
MHTLLMTRKYDLLADVLRKKAVALPGGSKLPSVRHLMHRYGYSLPTINAAIRKLEQEGMVEARHGSGIYVSPQKDVRCIEFHRPRFPSKSLDSKERSLSQAVTAAGWQMSVCCHDSSDDDPALTHNPAVSAHVVMPEFLDLGAGFFDHLASQGAPIVAYGREAGPLAMDFVTGDDWMILSLLVTHLAGLGHGRLAMLVNEPDYFEISRRREIFADVLQELGLPAPMFVECRTQAGENSSAMAYRGLRRFLDGQARELPFTALIIASTAGVVGAIRALYEAGVRVPDTCSLASFGEETENGFYIPSVTDAGIAEDAWGQGIVELLKRRFEAPRCPPIGVKLTARLNVRESTPRPAETCPA